MAQADQTVQNATFPTVRADINNNLAALFSANSGNTAPSVTVAFQDWIDTSGADPVWKKRNAANNAWITIATIVGNDLEFNSDITIRSQGDLRLGDSDNSNWVALQAPATVASNVTWTLPAADGSADQSIVTDGSGALSFAARSRLVSGTSVASTSGTSIDFTGIPSWVKRVTVMFDGVSTNGTSNHAIQIGDSGGIETSGYTSLASDYNGAGTSTSNFILTRFILAAHLASGIIEICNISGNTWVESGQLSHTNVVSGSAGTKTLSNTLTQVRITTVNGTDTFDAGSINIMYEG